MSRLLLIVDDIRINREILKKILGDEYEVLEAADGQEAMAVMNREVKRVSAVLLDLGMPVMDGFEVLSRMRESDALSQIPVIVMTGQTDSDTEERALRLGAKDYISKPYKSAIVKQRILNTIRLRETAATVNALTRDRLTGLYSRETFFEKCAEMIAEHEAGYYVMACFDVDSFKIINDQYGTKKGDETLRHIAVVFQKGFDWFGGICCRVASDDFAALYPSAYMDSDELAGIRERAARVDGLVAPLTFSIGRYVVVDPTMSPSAMFDRAVLAGNSVKGRFDTRIALYDESMREKLVDEQQVVTEMVGALEGGQFEPWFQPQYNHTTGALIGAEALVRWRHPERGLIPPYRFIPVFEQNGFIYTLDQYMLESVCRHQRAALDAGGAPLPVSVNVSRYDVLQPDIVEKIVSIVEKYDVPVELLRLEITESAFGASTRQVVDVAKKLIAHGFTLEIDDFGSGYSSLNTLKDVPAQVIKLDMRFLEGSGNTERGGNIIESVVRMAKWLGMSIIAEGVETVEQADFLKSIGCNYVQGYLYARPMPLADYRALRARAAREERLLALETVKNLDNNTFWDPGSMDTLIFNSYVGGACICEYVGGKQTLLRVNDKYVQAFGANVSAEDVFRHRVEDYMDEQNRAILLENLRRAAETGAESTCETKLVGMFGAEKPIYIRSTVRLIARAGDRCLLYCTIINTTDLREAEQKRVEAAERLSAIMADAGSGITASVYKDGAFRFLFSNDTYYALLGYSRDEFNALFANPISPIHPDDRALVAGAAAEAYRARGSAKAEYRVVCRDGSEKWLRAALSCTRFTGVEEDVQLGIHSDITNEKRDELALKDSAALLQTLMDDTPGGFCRMRVYPDGNVRPVYFNEGFMRLLRMSHDEIMAIYERDAMAGVHPDDVPIVRDAVARMLENGEASSTRYRLILGNGDYLWVAIFGRATRDESGGTFFNIYYTDATEQVKTENQQKDLLDNLPGGAALYEYDGRNLTVVHINKRYWELVNRQPDANAPSSILVSVHPDDRAGLKNEIDAAIRAGRDVIYDIRLCYGDGGYRPFHAVGRVVAKTDGKYAVYAAYTPISDEAMSIREMLPVALRAMMDTQSGYSFVKDRNLRYVCCSRTVYETAGLCREADLIGKTDEEILGRAVADEYAKADRRVLESGEPVIDIDGRLPSPDGATRYSVTSKFPLKDSAGNIIGIYGIGRDVTEDRAAKSRLELLNDNLPGGIAIYEGSPAALDQIKLVYFSDGLCRLFDYSRAEYAQRALANPFGQVFPDDLPALRAQVVALVTKNMPIDCVYRAYVSGGGYKWINLKAVWGEPNGDTKTVNAVLFDVTARQAALEKLRVSEEENRLAMSHSKNVVCRYDVAARTLSVSPSVNPIFGVTGKLTDLPYGEIRAGRVSADTSEAYVAFYDAIARGEKSGEMAYQRMSSSGWRWIEAHFSTIFAGDGKPVSAVVSFSDVTESYEKDAAYKKWQQSLRVREPDMYTLYRCNLTKQTLFDGVEGDLIPDMIRPGAFRFDERTSEYAARYVAAEDARRFVSFLNLDSLLASYYQGDRTAVLEYREKLPTGGARWLRLTVDLVEYPGSADIEAYLLFENIDDAKRAELTTRERAETDSLTGVMNRATFEAKTNALLRAPNANTVNALLMIDVDGFKRVNDVFGHSAGDQALADIADSLRFALRRDDLVGRLGGDEFVALLRDMPDDAAAANKARQICALIRKSFSIEVEITGSVGISVAPRDGADFETLYKKADSALYYVKGSGKDNYAFYHDNMADENLEIARTDADAGMAAQKRRMLIVDDNVIDHALLSSMFSEDFIIEKAKDGSSALIRLRHYGSAISVVLLDLMMPGMDGFAVLAKMRESAELRSIPVVVVSGDGNRETSLKAIRSGASDYVTKPVDRDVLRIRVLSAIAKADNERLRAKNSFLEYQNGEVIRYKTVLEKSGLLVVEHDWITGGFTYDPAMSSRLMGVYDDRKLWHILLADLVADTAAVKKMQETEHAVAMGKDKTDAETYVQLKTALRTPHWFRMCAYKTTNEFDLTDKIYLTFCDMGLKRPAEA